MHSHTLHNYKLLYFRYCSVIFCILLADFNHMDYGNWRHMESLGFLIEVS